MKMLITGSSGYLGTLLTDFLVSQHIPVAGIGLQKHPKTRDNELSRYYYCDVADKHRLSAVFEEVEPTHVIHLASTFNKVHDRKRVHLVDVEGSRNILAISDATPSVRQLIYSSSAVAYGGYSTNPEWIPESFPLNPGKYQYGLNKSIVEDIYSSTPVRNDLHLLILRICQVTGPSCPKDNNFLKLLLKSPVLPRVCMKNRVQLLHESDFLSLMSRILHDEEIQGIYNMAPDTYSPVMDLAPNKLYIPMPLMFISAFLWTLWNMRLLNLQAESVNHGIFPIILDPARLKSQYEYRFRYSTLDAFSETMLHDKRFTATLQQLSEITVSHFFKKPRMQ